MKHYYTNNDELGSEQQTFTFQYRNQDIKFISDIGVFSKSMIDYGSQVLLNAIELDENKKTVLDVGCGYGTFGICLKKRYPHILVDMVDVNDRALSLANLNVINNQLSDISIYESDGYKQVEGSFDIIVTNPPIRAGKQTVFRILEESYQYLNDNGEIWVVIQKKQGAPSTKNKLIEVFGNVEIVKKDKGYYIFRAIKRTSSEK